MKVEWWWLVVVAAVVWWWRGQRDNLAEFKNTPGYKNAVAAGMNPLATTGVQVPPGSSVNFLTGEITPGGATNPQGTSAWTP